MTSTHAIRLYELLIQWGSIGKREIEIEWLKKTLMIENQYQSIKNLKARVIDVAIKQINEYSDLIVSYTQRKTGRNVSHVTFAYNKKPIKATTPPPDVKATAIPPIPTVPIEVDNDCFAGATIKISSANQAKLLKLRTPDEIRQCIAIANQNIHKAEQHGEKIKNLSAYYATAIREGWHVEKQQEVQKQKQQAEEQAQREKARKERERLAEIEHMKWLSEASGTPLEKLLPKRLFPDTTGMNVHTTSLM